MRVLIASCVRQDVDILDEFLNGLDELDKPDRTEYFFIQHNLSHESETMMYDWSYTNEMKTMVEIVNDDLAYVRDDATTHLWKTRELVDTIIKMKNHVLDYAKEHGYDYLFFTDSDQVYHPNTLIHLINQNKDIIGEICWTKWYPHEPELPNAWFTHPYGFPDDGLIRLRNEELLEIEGFGGCYLISKKALQSPISFNRTNTTDFWGEDRFFHIRSKSLGYISYIDTKYPYFHIYRKTDLPRLREWIKRGYKNEEISSLQRGTVLIAICIGEREIHPDTAKWVMNTLLKNNGWNLYISRGHPIDSNRNHVVKQFLTLPEIQRYEWLLFLDSDVVPPLGAAERLLFHGKKIIGGVCFIMGKEGTPTLNVSKDIGPGYVKADLKEVKGMGTGFLLIHRDVLKKVGKSPFRFRYDEWGVANVSGEDYDFCEKVVNLGYKIYADFNVQCEHYKVVGLKNINNTLARIINEVKQRERRSEEPTSNSLSRSSGDRG
jgi:GT2 family glycosyltransferase